MIFTSMNRRATISSAAALGELSGSGIRSRCRLRRWTASKNRWILESRRKRGPMLTVARPHMKAVLTAVFPLEKAGPIAVRLRKGVSQIAVRPSKADAQADSRRDLGGSRTQGRQR